MQAKTCPVFALCLLIITPFTVYANQQPVISAGFYHSLAVDNTGQAWGWGRNSSGQVGIGTENETNMYPLRISTLSGVSNISAGSFHSMALLPNRTVWTWGGNTDGRLGNGTTDPTNVPVYVYTNARVISAGNFHTLVIPDDLTLSVCGWNLFGQLGNGTTNNSATFDSGNNLTNLLFATGGYGHSLAIGQNNKLYSWGRNNYGQLGSGDTNNVLSPQTINLVSIISALAGNEYSLALDANGIVWAWGYNSSGQIGNGTLTNIWSPVQILSNVSSIAIGAVHSLALKTDGVVWAWGGNSGGQLGNGTYENTNAPIPVISNVVAIDAGGLFSMALKSDGSVWSWGHNNAGQLGAGITNQSWPSPIFVTNWTNAVTAPAVPSESSDGYIGLPYVCTLSGATSSWGRALEYQVDWGNGATLQWTLSPIITNLWNAIGMYNIKARARNVVETNIISDWSATLTITVNAHSINDYDGDGKSDLAFYRDGYWSIFSLANGLILANGGEWGGPDAIPVQ
ncbi:MAG: hypothetical protein ABIH24_10360 [Verrucomicrobiota bacterium]